MKINHSPLEAYKNENIDLLNRDDVIDIKEVAIDNESPKLTRLKKYIQDYGNPYIFGVGKVVVKVEYQSNGISFNEKLMNILKRHCA